MIDAAIVVCRFLFDVSAIFLWGSAAYLWLMVGPELRSPLWRRLAPCRRGAVAAVLVSTLAILPLRTALLGEGWSAGLDTAMLAAVVTSTSIGTAWLVQIAAGTLLALTLALAPMRVAPAATAAIGAVLLASLSLTGHAAMNSGWTGSAQQANNALHLLAGGFWIGALPVVLLLLPRLCDGRAGGAAAEALRRFSNAGHAAVVLVLVSGVASTLLIVGRFPLPAGSPYQVLLLAKIALVLSMVAIAIVNRYVVVPRLVRDAGAGQALARGTLAEIVLSGAVIALVAAFGMMQPQE